MKRNDKTFINNVLYPVITLGIIVLLWWIAARIIGTDIILASPEASASEFVALLSSKVFYSALMGTVYRSLLSFIYAALSAFILSVLAALLKPLSRLLDPLVLVLRSVPTMSVILITLVMMKSTTGPILISFLITFPIMYSGFYTAFTTVDKDLISMSDVYGVRIIDKVFKLYVPSGLPAIFGAMRSSISLSVKVMIASEVMAQTRASMGLYMQRSMVYFDSAELIAWTIAAVIASYILEYAIEGIKRLIVRWEK
jgi:NitT/TauT family transport system permease protein